MKRISLIGFAVIVVLLSSAACMPIVTIGPDEIGLWSDPASGDLREPLTEGVYFLDPAASGLAIYPLGEQVYRMGNEPEADAPAVAARTADSQAVEFGVVVHFTLDGEQLETLHRTWGGRYANDFIAPMTRSTLRDLAAGVALDAIYADSGAALAAASTEVLGDALAHDGLILAALEITAIGYPDEFTQAIATQTEIDRRVTQAHEQAQMLMLTAEAARAQALATATAAAQITPTPSP